jgi:hypothetical protein
MNMLNVDALSEAEFTDKIQEMILRVMGVLYESELVEGADLGAMMRLFGVDEEVCQYYDGNLVTFDNDFLVEYYNMKAQDNMLADAEAPDQIH